MRVRKPIHFRIWGSRWVKHDGVYFCHAACGTTFSYYAAPKRLAAEPARRVTVKLPNVTCDECLTAVIDQATCQRAARLKLTRTKAPIRTARANVPARRSMNALAALVEA